MKRSSFHIDLRILRMWHWREVMRHRGKNDKLADFHIKTVQTLNDAPGMARTTAEQDCEEFRNFLRAIP